MKKIIISTILLAFAGIAHSQTPKTHTQRGIDDPAAHKVLNDVRKNLKSFKNLKFEFSLITENRAEPGKNSVQKGSILIKGEQYNLNFMGITSICDGKTVWNYNPETSEVHINTADPSSAEMLNPLSWIDTYEQNFRTKLIREDKEKGIDVMIIDLIPLENRSFHKVRMLTDKAQKTIVKIEIHEKNSVILTFRIDKMQTNTPATEKEFKFDAAKFPEVDVIDLR